MANSNIIKVIKNKIVRGLIQDELIVKVINSDIPFAKSENLINKHIFDYHQNPFTLNETTTFLTIQVQIPKPYVSSNNSFVSPEVEIWIISHHSRMVINDIPKITENRNDYLSELIDKKFNGRNDFGFGKLELTCNEEGGFQKDYLYRRMLFKTTDLNNSLCEVEE